MKAGCGRQELLVRYFIHYDDFIKPRTEKHYRKEHQVRWFIPIQVDEHDRPPFPRRCDLYRRNDRDPHRHHKQQCAQRLIQERRHRPEIRHQGKGGGHTTHGARQAEGRHEDARLQTQLSMGSDTLGVRIEPDRQRNGDGGRREDKQ